MNKMKSKGGNKRKSQPLVGKIDIKIDKTLLSDRTNRLIVENSQ
jgi:hypothetical protein